MREISSCSSHHQRCCAFWLHPADLEEICEGECWPLYCLYPFEYRRYALSTADTESNEGCGEISPFKFVEGSTE